MAERKRTRLNDPRVIMRAIIGVLLAANLVAAVIAFKPFGGSADDLRRERDGLRSRLAQAQKSLAETQRLASKVQTARTESEKFLNQYFLDSHIASDVMVEELYEAAQKAGVNAGVQQFTPSPIEGTDVYETMTVSQTLEGNYSQLTKFVHLLDRSPRFLIIDSLQAAAPQSQAGKAQVLNVTLKIKVFVRHPEGAAL